MRNRLIKSLEDADREFYEKLTFGSLEESLKVASNVNEIKADYLLADGWIRPPCKVGDKVYFVVELEDGNKFIHSQQINDVSTRGIFVSSLSVGENCDEFESYSEFGKTVFLTREEAEKSLKGGDGE